MRIRSNATASARVTQAGAPLPPGLVLGALGVLGFSFSLPATRLAVADLDPWFVAFGRAAAAAALAGVVLAAGRAPLPTRSQFARLTVVAAGVVLGFPLFTSLALQGRTAAHSAAVIALLPAATAVAAVLRAGERPTRRFWLASAAGMLCVLGFAVGQGAGDLRREDLFLVLAVLLCALGYAEGGALSRDLGGARTICWALLAALPVTLPVTVAVGPDPAAATAWLGFAYVALISMFLGFFAWYAGLARGGVAKVGQIQLLQPLLTLTWSAAILGEYVGPATLLTALAVLACVVVTQRARVERRVPVPVSA